MMFPSAYYLQYLWENTTDTQKISTSKQVVQTFHIWRYVYGKRCKHSIFQYLRVLSFSLSLASALKSRKFFLFKYCSALASCSALSFALFSVNIIAVLQPINALVAIIFVHNFSNHPKIILNVTHRSLLIRFLHYMHLHVASRFIIRCCTRYTLQ